MESTSAILNLDFIIAEYCGVSILAQCKIAALKHALHLSVDMSRRRYILPSASIHIASRSMSLPAQAGLVERTFL